MVQVATVAGSLAMAVGICGAQVLGGAGTGNQTGPHQAGGMSPASAATSSLDTGTSIFPDNSRQKRNDERQRRIVSDTQKLLALTSQLKAEVASTGAEAMTPEMLKQMDEIEKLAKSVKDRMRD